MDDQTRSWLIGVPFHADASPEKRQRPVLSRGQKRELAGFTGLVMASTVFFLTPLILSAPESPAPVQLAQASVGTVGTVETIAPGAPPVAVAARLTPPAPEQRATTMRRSVPATAGRVAIAPRVVNHTTSVRTEERARGARGKGISAGILRALVGNGRYRVQPFPTPATD